MPINTVRDRPINIKSKRLNSRVEGFQQLLTTLRDKELPEEIVSLINIHVDSLNEPELSDSKYHRKLGKAQTKILALLEKELKLVPKNYYRTRWLAVGMAAFGIPFGVVFGISLGNMGFIGIGIPIGIAVGLAIGSGMDKKAFDTGNQLDVDLKF